MSKESMEKAKELLEILDSKKELFQEIYKGTQEQNIIINYDEIDLEKAEHIVGKKEKLMREINELDMRYEKTYRDIKKDMMNNTKVFKDIMTAIETKKIQLTKIAMNIQSLEKINTNNVHKSLNEVKQRLHSIKKGQSTTARYNKVMDTQYDMGPIFLDKKK